MQFKLLMLIVLAITIGSLGVVASKVSSAKSANKIPFAGLELPLMEDDEITEAVSEPVIASVDLKKIEQEKITRTVGKCIVTLFGVKYDFTELNSGGTNGDMFDCGQDMSSQFSAKYGNNVSRLQRYMVASITPSPTSVSINKTNTQSATNGEGAEGPTKIQVKDYEFEDDSHEREDNEHKDRYEKEEIEPTEKPESTKNEH